MLILWGCIRQVQDLLERSCTAPKNTRPKTDNQHLKQANEEQTKHKISEQIKLKMFLICLVGRIGYHIIQERQKISPSNVPR